MAYGKLNVIFEIPLESNFSRGLYSDANKPVLFLQSFLCLSEQDIPMILVQLRFQMNWNCNWTRFTCMNLFLMLFELTKLFQ